MHTKRRRRRVVRKHWWKIPAIGLTVVLLWIFEQALSPLITAKIQQQAELLTTETVNRAIAQWMETDPDLNLTRVERDDSGDIVSIEADTARITQLQARLGLLIQQHMATAQPAPLRVAVGTLLGGNLLREWGPSITARFSFASSAHCTLENRFSSAGINQTVHEVWLHVEANVYAMIPGKKEPISTGVSYCIAQTVITGKVPSVNLTQ